MRRVTIDPLTRVEGHGRVEIFLNDDGDVENAYLIVPELRGFESLCIGRPAEEMPAITSRICGLCPEAHLMASAKALDDLFQVEPPPAARKLRELFHCSFFVRDHATHFFVLAGADLFLDPDAPPSERSFFGVVRKLGAELGRRIIEIRMRNYHAVQLLGGRGVHAVAALPGGWSRSIDENGRRELEEVARENVAFALETLAIFEERVLRDPAKLELLTSSAFADETYYMSTVDGNGKLSFYDGRIRVVGPDGREHATFPAKDYVDHIAERVEPWTYVKFPYLRNPGWNGFIAGATSGVYLTSPLGRLNAAGALATPRAQEAFEMLYDTLGARREEGGRAPIHNRFVTHWARLVELLAAAERMLELAGDPEITDAKVRAPLQRVTGEGVGSVEAPRGTLVHHYRTDSNGIITGVNLLVGTTNNHAAMALTVSGAARSLIGRGVVPSEPLLTRLESVVRAYDPCFSCATHTYPGGIGLEVRIRDLRGELLQVIRRES